MQLGTDRKCRVDIKRYGVISADQKVVLPKRQLEGKALAKIQRRILPIINEFSR